VQVSPSAPSSISVPGASAGVAPFRASHISGSPDALEFHVSLVVERYTGHAAQHEGDHRQLEQADDARRGAKRQHRKQDAGDADQHQRQGW
jgi:hypothetical protein